MLFRFTLQAILSAATATAKSDGRKSKTVYDEGSTNIAFHDSFIPKKLAAKYHKAALNENNLNVADGPLRNQEDTSVEAVLKNPSSYGGSKLEATAMYDATPSDLDFDSSNELGILDGARMDEHRELEEFSLADCDGKRPKVSPIVNFKAVIKRCRYYQDNCPYNVTLPMGCWDTSEVTDMSYAFYQLHDFNEPINTWDTSSVTDMSDMFGFATNFNQPLDSWNLQSVTDSSDMFWGAQSFNQPVDSWDVSTIQNFDYMFLDARQFNQPLDSWETSSATDMKYMFAFSESFNQPLNHLRTSGVTDMTSMFAFAQAFDQPLDEWETQSVTSMRQMFVHAESFNQNVDDWNTRSVTDMTYMFNNAYSFSQCLSTWAYKNPTAITGAFIFNGTDCPVQGIPDIITGPWCQGEYDQCFPVYPSASSGETSRPLGLSSAILLGGAFMMPDILSSFFF